MAVTSLAVDRATLTERVYANLRADLLDGRRAPGARLNEKELAAQFGVSPTPVREALNKLRSEGLVEYRPWIGTVASEFGPDDLVHLSNVRLYLECLAVREASARFGVDDLAELERRQAVYAQAAARGIAGATEVARANAAFHGFFAERSGNRWLQQMLSGLEGLLLLARRPLSLHRTGAESIPEHAAIVQALRSADADAAEAAMRAHLSRVRDALLVEVGSAAPTPDREEAVQMVRDGAAVVLGTVDVARPARPQQAAAEQVDAG